MMDTARRTRGAGWRVPKGEMEVLLWAGTPHIRTRTLLKIFALWSMLLVHPVFVLVEAVSRLAAPCAAARAARAPVA